MLTNVLFIISALIVVQLVSMLFLRIQQGKKFVIAKSLGFTLVLASAAAISILGSIEELSGSLASDVPVPNSLGAYMAGTNTLTLAQHHEYTFFFTVFVIGLIIAAFASLWFEGNAMSRTKSGHPLSQIGD